MIVAVCKTDGFIIGNGLYAEEREYLTRYKKESLRHKQSSCGILLAKNTVASFLKTDANSVCISHEPAGKPVVKERPDVYLSIAHSGEYVVCAVSGNPVGADIEMIRPINTAVSKKVCTQNEIDWIHAGLTNKEPSERHEKCRYERFFTIWCLKESFGKLCGKGLHDGVKAEFEFNGTWRISGKDNYNILTDTDRVKGYIITTIEQINSCD